MKTIILSLALVAAGSSRAGADPLPEQRHMLVQLTQFLRYDRFTAESHGGRLGISTRLVLGSRLGYGVGLDLDAGAAEDGAVYNAELWPLGIALRAGDSGLIALLAGVGVGGAGGGVLPTALQLPIELRGRVQLGPVRATAWTTARMTPFTDSRGHELEGALALGWGRQDTYWRGTSAGSGPYLAVAARRVDDDIALAISVGLELVGAN